MKVYYPITDKPTKEIESLDVTFEGETDLNVFLVNNILKIIDQLNEYKSIGRDGLHPLVIKRWSTVFAPILSNIFLKSFTTIVVPAGWKKANITQLFKKRDRSDAANYRLISLTQVPSKMMEKV